MAKITPIEGLIPGLYRAKTLHTALFFWINGQRMAFPNGISIDISLKEFYKFVNITEDDMPIRTAKQVYTRMNKELIEKIRADA